MKSLHCPSIRHTLLALLFSGTLSLAQAMSVPSSDAPEQALRKHGSVMLESAGKFVAPGTFRVQVAAKLGRPDLTLADGTYLYHHHRIANSAASGTLVVRFTAGRVSSLALVTPAVAIALRDRAAAGTSPNLLANR